MEIWRELLRRRVTLTFNNGNKYVTDDPEGDIMRQLIEKTRTLGRPLTFDEMKSDPEMFTPMTYAIYYDSFSQAAIKAWDRIKYDDKQTNLLKESEANLGKRFSREEVVRALKSFYEANGRLPLQTEASGNGLPSWQVIVKHLGHKENWLAIINDEGTNNEAAETSEPETIEPIPTANNKEAEFTPAPAPAEQVQTIDNIEADSSYEKHDDGSIAVELKITIPGRERPIIVNLTV